MTVFQTISVSIGSVFLGISIVFFMLVHISNQMRIKRQENYGSEAFLATLISIVPLSIALAFFGLALA